MIVPVLGAGIEQRHNVSRLWIYGSHVAALAAVILGAGLGQVVGRRCAAMLLGYHMVNLVDKGSIFRMRPTVLAAFARPSDDQNAQS